MPEADVEFLLNDLTDHSGMVKYADFIQKLCTSEEDWRAAAWLNWHGLQLNTSVNTLLWTELPQVKLIPRVKARFIERADVVKIQPKYVLVQLAYVF